MKVLVTGGAGYVGTHVCVALCKAGYQPVILDSFGDASTDVVARLTTITGRAPLVERGNVLETGQVLEVLQRHQPCAVIHLAHHQSDLASMADRLRYLGNRLTMLASVLRAMELHGIHVLQVASSAEVYRASDLVPLAEHSPREPYDHAGHAHVMVEKLLEGMQEINPAWRVAVLRHFSIGGAHPSGLIGPSRLTRYPGLLHGMARASLGMQAQLDVSTDHGGAPDGSTICDFIHVRDVARAHVAALDAQLDFDEGFRVNVGSGRATSVLEMLRTFEKVTRRLVPWRHVTHITPGATYRVADTRLITELLGWKPRHTLEELCSDTLRWHRHVSQGLAKVR